MGQTVSYFEMKRKSQRRFNLVLALCILTLFWSARFLGSEKAVIKVIVLDSIPRPHRTSLQYSKETNLDLSHLQHIVSSPTFEYGRRVIKTQHSNGERIDLTRVHETLTPLPIIVQKMNISNISIPNAPPLTLQVPRSPQVDTSIFNFGMATTVPRLKLSVSQISHWLAHSDAQLHVLAPTHKDSEVVQSQMQTASMNATIVPVNQPFPITYFSLIKALYESRTPKTQWLVLADDDTFFPSLSSLAGHFKRKYNPNEEVIVSATSDNLGQIHAFGLIPFGGGGVFISLPLAAQLLKPHVWEACIATSKTQGDQIVSDCLDSFTSIRPIFDPLLHQMDIRGEPVASAPEAGYFESGRQMLSIHHWRSWFEFDVARAANVSRACGDEGLFQRWLFDGDTVVSNGYSVTEYPTGVTEEELGMVEYTWNEGEEEEKWRYVHMMGPLRQVKTEEEKKTKMLVEAIEVDAPEGRGIRQIYVEKAKARNEDGSWEEGKMDKVVELLWLI